MIYPDLDIDYNNMYIRVKVRQMKKILMTGGTGFVGSNVLSILQENKNNKIIYPTRDELNLKNEKEVVNFIKEKDFDVILHFANPTPAKNQLDSFDTLMEDGLRIFLNFYNHRNLFGKMIYTGSGAEFDKTLHMNKVSEEDCFRSIPQDSYGLSKMIMNQLADQSDNIYNFRIFGCYGPGDHESKFITHCIRSVILNKPITIRKDCQFDYIHVYDFAKYVEWGINNNLKFHSYNVSSGKKYFLTEIAQMVTKLMNSNLEIKVLSEQLNNNYSADNNRIVRESGLIPSLSLEEGIKQQIMWEEDNWSENTRFDGE